MRRSVASLTALAPRPDPPRPAPPCEMSSAGSRSSVPNTSLAGVPAVPVGRNATAAQSQQGRHLCVSNLHSGLGQHKRVYPGTVLPPLHTHTLGWDEACWLGFRMGRNKTDSPNMQHGIAVSSGVLAGGCTVHSQ